MSLVIVNHPRGDLEPPLTLTLSDALGTIDLTLAVTTWIVMWNARGERVLRREAARLDQTVAATKGKIRLAWSAGDLIETSGVYLAKGQVLWGGERPQTVPSLIGDGIRFHVG